MSLPMGETYKALNRSIDVAVAAGRLDRTGQAALIAAARKLARLMDVPGWPTLPDGKFDNVSPALFLKYCDAMGIVPDAGKAQEAEKGRKLAKMRADMPKQGLRVVNG